MKTSLKHANPRCTLLQPRSNIVRVFVGKTTFMGRDDENDDSGYGKRESADVWEKRHKAAIQRATVRHLNTIYKSKLDMSPPFLNKLVCEKWGNTARVRLTKRGTIGFEIYFDGTNQREYAARLGEICKYINKKDLGYCIKTMIESFPTERGGERPVWLPLDSDMC